MKAFTLTKITTFVSIIFIICGISGAQTIAAPGQSFSLGAKSDKQADDDRNYSREKDCQAAMDKIVDSKGKFLTACAQSGTGSNLNECSSTLSDCELMADSTQTASLDLSAFGIQMPSTSGSGPNKCSAYTSSDYRSELRDLERTKKDNEKDLNQLNKDNNKDEEEFSKNTSQIMNEMTELKEKKDEQDQKDQENERSIVSEQKKTQDSIEQNIRKLQVDVLQKQNQLALLIKQKAAQVEDYKIEIIKCKSEVRKFLSETPKSKSGSFKSLSSNGGGRNADAQTMWETCVNRVLAQRAAAAEAFKAKEAELQQAIANDEADIKSAEADLSLLTQQASQASTDRATKKQKDAANFLEKYKAKYNELASANSLMEQKRNLNQQAIYKANIAVTQASNDLNQLKADKPATKGNKTSSDAKEGLQTYLNTDCTSVCDFSSSMAKKCEDLRAARSKELGSSSSGSK